MAKNNETRVAVISARATAAQETQLVTMARDLDVPVSDLVVKGALARGQKLIRDRERRSVRRR